MKQNQRQLSRVGQQKIEQLRNLEIKFVGVSGWVKPREERKTDGRSVTEKNKKKQQTQLDEDQPQPCRGTLRGQM